MGFEYFCSVWRLGSIHSTWIYRIRRLRNILKITVLFKIIAIEIPMLWNDLPSMWRSFQTTGNYTSKIFADQSKTRNENVRRDKSDISYPRRTEDLWIWRCYARSIVASSKCAQCRKELIIYRRNHVV